jgi:hypothetical protein
MPVGGWHTDVAVLCPFASLLREMKGLS